MKSRTTQIILFLIVLAAGAATAFFFADINKLPNSRNTFTFQEPQPIETRLFFAGDIMLSRNVAARYYAANDFALPFRNIADKSADADISFANLESPFNDKGDHSVEGSLVFNADPKSIEGMKLAGIDIVSTANNHSFDQGQAGINYTIDWLQENGIEPVGTGLDCNAGKIIEKNGIKFGFLAYSYTAYNDGGKSTDPLVCDWNKQSQVTTDIANMRSQVDVLIVSAHMGTEYKRTPDEFNEQGAKNAIATGADLVIGHHPHWVQTIEHYKFDLPYTQNGQPQMGTREGWVFHSLGNYVFDQMWSQDTREGLTMEVLFKDKKLSRITLMPVVIENFCCPRWANDEETKSILQKINLTNNVLIPKNDEVH
jgi:poly-gamma-glutamate synthesis protein (capsule biosynthesis protein)